MAIQSESERSWLFDSSSARRCRLPPPRLLGDFWFISKRIICTHCSIACADKHGSCRYISSADFPISAGRKQGTLGNGLSMCAYANSLPQSFLFKASHFSSKRSPQSLLPKAFPQSSFLQSSLFKASSFSSKLFLSKLFSSKLFLSTLFVRSVFFKEYWRIFKEVVIKLRAAKRWRDGTCPQQNPQQCTACLTKIVGAAVRREALLDKKTGTNLHANTFGKTNFDKSNKQTS